MSYRLAADEAVPSALTRSAREQAKRAVTELTEGITHDPVRAVHNARKAIKKERSLLRLARRALPPEERRRENAALRDAAHRLSGTRDDDALISTIDGLSKRFAGQLPASTFAAIREQLAPAGGRAEATQLTSEPVAILQSVVERIDDWQLHSGGWKALESGLMRSYRRGRRALTRARSEPSLDNLHDWRKRVKDLWYQERLLAPSCGPVARSQAKEAHRLADLLGDDHDLGLLRHRLANEPPTAPVDVDAVVKLIDHRRSELQREAMATGQRLYCERPGAFRRRMRRSWKAGRTLASVPSEGSPADLAAATREPVHQ